MARFLFTIIVLPTLSFKIETVIKDLKTIQKKSMTI